MMNAKQKRKLRENAPIVQEIYQASVHFRLSIPELFGKAKVAPSNYYRWKKGETTPTNDKLSKVRSTIKKLHSKQKEKKDESTT